MLELSASEFRGIDNRTDGFPLPFESNGQILTLNREVSLAQIVVSRFSLASEGEL